MKKFPINSFLLVLAGLMYLNPNLGQAQLLVTGKATTVSASDVVADAETRIPPEFRIRVYSQPDSIGKIALNLYVRRVMADQAKAAGLDSAAAVSAALQVARDKILSDAWLAKLDADNAPSDALLERLTQTAYRGKSEQFKIPEKVKVRHILVANTDAVAKAKAEQLLKEVKAGADFAALAKQHSADPGSAARGGEIGPFAVGEMVKEFQEASFAMKTKGELSDLVQTRYGFHIIQFDERFPAGVKSYEEVKEQLQGEIRSDILQRARAQAAQNIETAAQLDVNAVKAFVETQKAK